MAVSTKISLFTPVIAVSDEGAMPAFWANFYPFLTQIVQI